MKLAAITVFVMIGCTAEPAPAPPVAPAPVAVPAAAAASLASQQFDGWLALVRETDDQIGELYYAYYDTSTSSPWFLSTSISAQVLEYELATGDTDRAEVIGDSLLAWQYDGSGTVADRLRGAFPSEIARDATTGDFAALYLYDSGDNLTVCEALLDLYDATQQPRFLDAATRVGTWLRDVMAHGEHYGVWLAPLGAPMKAVTDEGNFDNRIAVGSTLFSLPTLKRLSARTGDPSFAALAATAFAFLSQGQSADGAIYDHYDPSYPPQAFSPANFIPYEPGAVVADDSIRGALGLLAGGDAARVDLFLGWLEHPVAGIPGYLDFSTGGGFFPSDSTPYHDVVSSGLYAQLAARVANGDADAVMASMAAAQSPNGGWFWGLREDTGTQITADQSTITGLSALMDLSPLSN